MYILISNDDGYLAPGIATLANALQAVADIVVVAPDRNRSGASHSLTLDNPLRVNQAKNGFYYVDGTPSDCVHLAITGLLAQLPDMVVSGINAGANLGDDVIYSGTVAAAVEGRFLGLPAIALSMDELKPHYFETGAKVAVKLLKQLQQHPLPSHMILNVNIPDIPYERLQGFKVTRLGNRHKSEPVVASQDPRGRPIYWVGPVGEQQDAGVETDFYAVDHDFVSITPLQIDLTHYAMLSKVEHWLPRI